jgi:hypothetical protein
MQSEDRYERRLVRGIALLFPGCAVVETTSALE